VLVAADEVPSAVLARHADHARLHVPVCIAIQVVILRPMIGEPIISVIMVTVALSTVFVALMKWIFGVNLQPFPRVFTTHNGQYPRAFRFRPSI